MLAADSKKPNLILGIADNYTYYELIPFALTLREAGYEGHVCLFAGPGIGGTTVRLLKRRGFEIVRYGSAFPFIEKPHPRTPRALPDPIHIYNFRHFLYLDYLLKHEGEFGNVLITDVRDVFFQRDPFNFPIEDKVHVAMENPAIPLGQCDWNRTWLEKGFGYDVAVALAEKPISCAGTTLGPAAQVVRYLATLLAKIAEMDDALNCADQAAHNVLLYEGKLEPVRRLHNHHGPVLTLGNETTYQLNGHGELVNVDGSVVNIVHQYDRHPALQHALANRLHRTVWHMQMARGVHRVQRATLALRRVLR